MLLKDLNNDALSICLWTQKMTLWAYTQWPFEHMLNGCLSVCSKAVGAYAQGPKNNLLSLHSRTRFYCTFSHENLHVLAKLFHSQISHPQVWVNLDRILVPKFTVLDGFGRKLNNQFYEVGSSLEVCCQVQLDRSNYKNKYWQLTHNVVRKFLFL